MTTYTSIRNITNNSGQKLRGKAVFGGQVSTTFHGDKADVTVTVGGNNKGGANAGVKIRF